jgi:lipopolysaccharide biosynthesis protein
VHGHFHYPDLLADLVRRIRCNRTTVDLILTTHAEGLEAVTDTLSSLSVERARVEVVPNRGRNVGPFLTGAARAALSDYDLVVHVHGKRSAWAKSAIGERWRTFLWESLIGGEVAMLDTVVSAFEADDRLGVVFPEDPYLLDWARNRPLAETLAARMGVTDPLPNHFEFPVGTMFCARPAALRPLFDLELGWGDYPVEPVGIDGTLLHAIERLIPFCAAQAGYDFAATYVEGVFR